MILELSTLQDINIMNNEALRLCMICDETNLPKADWLKNTFTVNLPEFV
ncbi:hypothetical protein SAMN05421863_102911 [Nitrosomonas communis]|uniref:Uncharacterized protein n=1 Tax=Nitrosomonas communis TaxID=44574 RepID=A0A1I4QXD2_9PROT|nr:hypothetical protein SAMN05421863_102911 [Nitrosomonas communis]